MLPQNKEDSIMKVTFKVAMNAEEKKAKNEKTVEFEVDFTNVPMDTLQKHAVANMIVMWQSQIRSHWTEFTQGELPKKVTFGVPLFAGGRRGTCPVITVEKAEEHILGQDRLTQVRMAIKLMRANNMDVPDALIEEEVLLKMMQEEEQEVVK
jgi:hypothetical protein